MKKIILTILLMVLVCNTALALDVFEGTAKDLSGKLRYIEKYQVKTDPEGLAEHISTQYFDPDNKLIATLECDFTKHRFVPDSTYIDYRVQEEIVTRVEGKKLFLKFTNKKNNKVKTKTLDITPNMVMGQGYHNYVVHHFNEFKVGETRDIQFVVENKLDYFMFTFNFLGIDPKDKSQAKFRLDIKSWILKLFADAISVQYDVKNRWLMKFDGLTNVSNEKGSAEHLIIHYKH